MNSTPVIVVRRATSTEEDHSASGTTDLPNNNSSCYSVTSPVVNRP